MQFWSAGTILRSSGDWDTIRIGLGKFNTESDIYFAGTETWTMAKRLSGIAP
jgi:hypothetical protein